MCLFQPAQFEQCMVQMLQSLKEPMECKPGEINVQIFTQHSSSALPLQIIGKVISNICQFYIFCPQIFNLDVVQDKACEQCVSIMKVLCAVFCVC